MKTLVRTLVVFAPALVAVAATACVVQPPAGSVTPAVQPPVSAMAAVARLTATLNQRGPSDEVLQRGEPFLQVWHDYVDGKQDGLTVHGWRDHVQVNARDGTTMSCRFRDTPDVAVKQKPGFANDSHLSVTFNCDGGVTYERYWDVFPSIGGAEVMTTLRPVADEIVRIWRPLAVVPVEAPGGFEARAEVCRAGAASFELPESAREFKVRAENAVVEKRFVDAVEAYDRGLQLAPCWPQGHFNVALVLGEVNTFGLAIEEMDRYLLLAPDATNARQAQDKIYAWRGKLELPL